MYYVKVWGSEQELFGVFLNKAVKFDANGYKRGFL